MSTTTSSGAHAGDRAPAQLYCLVAGAALLIAGIAGFFANSSFSGAGSHDQLIVFDVNGWHNVVHILSGLVLLGAAPRAAVARAVALAFGVTYGAVAIYGFIDGNDVVGLIPVNTADNVLHVVLAVLGILAGVAPAVAGTPPADPREYERSIERFGVAADASSPNQAFVGLREAGGS